MRQSLKELKQFFCIQIVPSLFHENSFLFIFYIYFYNKIIKKAANLNLLQKHWFFDQKYLLLLQKLYFFPHLLHFKLTSNYNFDFKFLVKIYSKIVLKTVPFPQIR